MSVSNDGSESVDQFLARVASLSRRNDEEVAERNRKMEEEMMQARKQRRARREERARSLSPVKTGPAAAATSAIPTTATGATTTTIMMTTASTAAAAATEAPLSPTPAISSPPAAASIKPPVVLAPRPQTQTPSQTSTGREDSNSPVSSEALSSPPFESSRPLPPPPLEKPAAPTFPLVSTTTLSRSGTLSWQQRPLSRDGGSIRSRPLSVTRGVFREPTEKAVERPVETAKPNDQDDKSKPKLEPEPEPEPSRADIAASLGARDPSWFRQTADRGIGSAAYRKSNEDSDIALNHSRRGTQLPGMASQPSKADTPRQKPVRPLSASPAPPSPGLGVNVASDSSTIPQAPVPASGNTPLPAALASSPEPESSPRAAAASLNRTASILGSPGRPPSPTKGLGGFVQSAMMKRSDSVSKRWSVQANGLKRGDSVAGGRPTFNPPAATPSLGRPRVLTRDPKPNTDGASSPLSSSRPSSAHAVDELADPVKDPVPEQDPDVETKQERPVTPSSESLLSRSPSKTMDPRRWSPTKASWLESALAKPESPRPAPMKVELPAWKIGLERSKSQRRPDASPTRSTNFDSVTTNGLLRHPSPGSPAKTSEFLARPASLTDESKVNAEIQSSQAAEKLPKRQEFASTQALGELIVEQKPSSPLSHLDRSKEQVRDIADEGIEVVPGLTTTTQDMTLAGNSPLEGSADQKPPALKPKPQTPPKPDFRSTLRSRQVDSTASRDNELEFKAVFGKLKPTQTQNYVAPDVFKQNITHGKAALHVTGGPQKTKRVDELKESLLSRKEEMKAGGGSIHKRPNIRGVKESPQDKEPEVPEALARRKTLHKTNPSATSTSTKPQVEAPKFTVSNPVAVTALKAGHPALKPAAPTPVQKADKPLLLPLESTSAPTLGPEGPKEHPAALVNKPAPSSAPVRKPPEKATLSPPSDPISPTGNTSPDRELTKTTSYKLAARLNPALAGLIARGNSSRAVNDVQSTDASPATLDRAAPFRSEEPDGSSGLTHMTKGRAKGPRRRAPKAEPTSTKSVDKTRTESPSTASGPVLIEPTTVSPAQLLGNAPETESNKPAVSPKLLSSQKSGVPSSKLAAIASATPSAGVAGNVAGVKEKPRVASKSSELRRVSEKARLATHQSPPGHLKVNPSLQAVDTDKGFSPGLTPSKSPRPIAAPARSPEKSMPLTPSKTRLNTPKMPDPVAALPVHKAAPKTGLGLSISADPKLLSVSSELTPPPEKEGKVYEVTSTTSDVEKVLLNAFGAVPRIAERLEFDTEAFLTTHSSKAQRIKTISNKIMKVTGDGKQTPIAPSQEHILYEDSMYLCVHTFESTGSKLTEVYLWTGDTVPEAAVEDAQIFCRKVARDNDAKLQVLKQGMESPAFLSALGGILIVRKNASSDLYMLCGRRHGGHIVFDQVEFSPTSLCSGFSYLISAKFGKLYLWIGAGSCADEYGAARLIGTDLGLTGEIEEVTEGKEPAAFWKAFSAPTAKQQYQPSKTWAMRAGNEHNGFPCKLYRIEQERPKSSGGFWVLRSSSPPKSLSKVSLQEIDPFSQRDLTGDCVHLLDAYAALYVIPGKPSPLKAADFVSALHIAQELAVLTPSLQDRPLLPSCYVAFGEPPRDCRAAFRKWTLGKVAGAREPPACFDVADVMKVLA